MTRDDTGRSPGCMALCNHFCVVCWSYSAVNDSRCKLLLVSDCGINECVYYHPNGVECVVLLPVSLFMVCHALRLECVKSTDSTTSVHLALRTSSSLCISYVAVGRCLHWWWPAGAREGGGCSCRPIRGCSLC